MAHQFGEGVDLGRLQGFGLGDQVLVAGRASSRDEVDADRRGGGAVVRRRELVDDGRHASRGVLGGLAVLDRFGRNEDFD